MEKFYQVFVSSTFSDLEDERKKVSDALAKAGMIPAGMELFPATSLKQLEFIKKVIDRCDYYVVIVGARYGSLDGDKSFTEKEYEYALSKNIPVLAFIHKAPGKIAADKTDSDPTLVKKLELFRERLKNGRVVYFWTDINDLCMNVVITVASEINLSPGIGWIRGDQAIDPKIVQELEKARIENAELEKKLDQLAPKEISFSPDIAGPEDYFEFEIYWWRDKTQNRTKGRATLRNIYIIAYDAILKKHSESQIGDVIASNIFAEANPEDYFEGTDYHVIPYALEAMRFQFEALGLIVATTVSTTQTFGSQTFHSEHLIWALTEKGRSYMSKLRALPNPNRKK